LDNLSRRFDFKEGSGVKLGTMMGVFVPTLQNILGIILFLRLPWIAGQAGIIQALAIVLLGCSASFLTALSMSAIATNGVPKGGGAFSVIKESIGPEFGGTVGCLLFLSNTFG
jgi:solute carrier family 12 (potassium/chloride transporter), member 4/6